MKGLFRRFILRTEQTDPTKQICRHPKMPEQFKSKQLISLSRDHCQTCQQYMCNACSDQHIINHCSVKLGTMQNKAVGILKDFNFGYLMKVDLRNIRCICGKQILFNQASHAMCVACGLISCSNQCHSQWEKLGNCTYHNNYYDPPKNLNMRSVLMQNISNIQKSKISQWSLANKTSLSFISCYASKINTHVYLQRGFRQYGIPQQQLISRMHKIQFGIDYTTHIQRLCDCQCISCRSRPPHSAGNCEYECSYQYARNVQQYHLDETFHYQCKCTCSFCKSGIIVSSHRKLDCITQCYRSPLIMDGTIPNRQQRFKK